MTYTTEQAQMMGFQHTSPITPEARELHDQTLPEYHFRDKRVTRITRLRLAGDGGLLDVQYCHGVLADGTAVDVILPEYQFRYSVRNGERMLKAQFVGMAQKSGRYAKDMGLFDFADVISICY